MEKTFVAVDIETTGIAVTRDRIIEIGAVKYIDGKVEEKFNELIDPGCIIPPFIENLTGISNSDVKGKRNIDSVISDFAAFAEGYVLLGHNINFDYSFLKQYAANKKVSFEHSVIDTVKLARKKYPNLPSRKLNDMCDYLGIRLENHHRAYDDALAAANIYLKMLEEEEGICNYSGRLIGKDEFKPKEVFIKPKKMSKITPAQKSYLTALIIKHGINADYEVDSLSKSEASRKIDKILSEYGRK